MAAKVGKTAGDPGSKFQGGLGGSVTVAGKREKSQADSGERASRTPKTFFCPSEASGEDGGYFSVTKSDSHGRRAPSPGRGDLAQGIPPSFVELSSTSAAIVMPPVRLRREFTSASKLTVNNRDPESSSG